MARRKKGNPVHGWVNFDKPAGMSSTQAVGKVRWLFQAQKAGHAGTLDPLATGILPIALGEATKTISYIQDALKSYEFEITWGEQRDTDDSEGKVIATSDHRPTRVEIEAALPAYMGEIQQTPPKFSAIKIDGERAYDLARDGKEFEIKSRIVYIENFELVDAQPHTARLRMLCGKGTYVRSLARDLALKLGTCGYVSDLRRTQTGPFPQETAISLDNLTALSDSAGLNQALLPLEAALDDILALPLRQEELARLRNGQVLMFTARPDYDRLEKAGLAVRGETLEALATCDGKAAALVEVFGPQVKTIRLFNL